METGDILELTSNFYKHTKGRKAYFIKFHKYSTGVEVVWFGEEKSFVEHQKVSIVPLEFFKLYKKKKELVINGIYTVKDKKGVYFIILEKINDFYYNIYTLDCNDLPINSIIQKRLDEDIANRFLFKNAFLELNTNFIHNSVDGYVGKCKKEIVETLKEFEKNYSTW